MEEPQPLETVYRSRAWKACFEHALVLEAAGIKFYMRREAGEHILAVQAPNATAACAELDAYREENRGWSQRVQAIPQRATGWLGVYGFVAVLLLVDILQSRNVFGLDWFLVGRTDAELILRGQLWRTVTALSLHSGWAHLAGNVVVGGIFGFFAAQLLGSGLAWFCILLAGAAGNCVNALIRQTHHTSVGASTSVFATLGIIVAFVLVRRRHVQTSWLVRWSPLVGGVVLLGYLGAGGARTDVMAHVAGFGCGLAIGALLGELGSKVLLSARLQRHCGFATMGILVGSWVLAVVFHDAWR